MGTPRPRVQILCCYEVERTEDVAYREAVNVDAASPGDRPVIAFHGTADTIVGFDLAAAPCGRAG